MRVGILTGGGDCPGLNAVIRAAAKTLLSLPDREVEVVGVHDGFLGLIQGRYGRLREEDVSGLLTRGGTILGSTNRDNPFDFDGMVDGEHVQGDMTDLVMRNYRRIGLDALLVIGGDGTMSVANRFAEAGMQAVGIPKTIDNDLAATDRTFGFDSAVTTATEAIDKIQTTADSHHRAMVVEVMGRTAGWICLEAGLAGGGDVLLIPEIPFRWEAITEAIIDRKRRGKRSSIVVVAEGAAAQGGEAVYYRQVATGQERSRLGGISHQVAAHIESTTNIETRVAILGHIQRGGAPTAFDRVLGSRFGAAAARCALAGRFGCMVALRNQSVVEVPLAEVANRVRRVPEGHELLQLARDINVSLGI